MYQWHSNRNNRENAYQAYRMAGRGTSQIQANAGDVIYHR